MVDPPGKEDRQNTPRLPRRSRKDDPKMIGGWKIGRTIGKGSSGRVKIARHSRTGQYAAIKIVSKHALITSRMSMSDMGEHAEKILLGIEREIVIMKLIDHPNVLSLYDVWETSGELYLIMEYVEGGELFDYLVSRGRLPVEEALHYFQQIIAAVDYCHRFNIAHRDLKPENLLLDKSRNIKVADFGMAAWEGGNGLLETSCGSPHYASPEVVEGRAYHGYTSDIWSCGVILFALLAGRLPFDDENIRVLLEKVKLGKYTMPPDIEPAAKDLIAKMLQKDVGKRITMPEILVHPFFKSRTPQPSSGLAVPPPTLEEVARPITEDIDPDILGNLRTLWHGAPDEDIIQGLTNSEQTWEKAVYHLLLKYRARHLENYDEDEIEPPRRKSANPSAFTQGGNPISDNSPIIAGPKRTVSVASHLSRMTTQEHHTRPSAPTPKKAARNEELPLPSDHSDPHITAEATNQRASIQTQRVVPPRPGQPYGPRPVPISRNSAAPSVNLPESTPARNNTSIPLNDTGTTAVSSGSSEPSLSPQPLVQIPDLRDEGVALFFQQIVEHLNTMQIRQSILSSSPEINIGPMLGGIAAATGQHLQTPHSTVATSPPTTMADSEESRFADADDDDTEAEQSTRALGISKGVNGYSQAVPNGTLAGDKNPPLSFGLGISNYEVPGAQVVTTRRQPTPLVLRPSMNAGNHNPQQGPYRPRPILTNALASHRHGTPRLLERENANTSPDKENELSPRSPNEWGAKGTDAIAPRPSLKHQERRRLPIEKHVQIVLPEVPNGKGLRKRRSATSSISSPQTSDRPFFLPSDSTPKRSWFGNLFKFKPASYNLLSVQDAHKTRDECQRLMNSFGVLTAVQNSDGAGILRCRLEEIRDPAGVMAVAKAVRFRVEFHGTSHAQSVIGYVSSLTMIQEKGALSSFKLVYNRLRREWSLDTPRTPGSEGFPSPAQVSEGKYARMIY